MESNAKVLKKRGRAKDRVLKRIRNSCPDPDSPRTVRRRSLEYSLAKKSLDAITEELGKDSPPPMEIIRVASSISDKTFDDDSSASETNSGSE